MTIVQNRWFNRQIDLLCRLKYVKRVHVPNKYRCIQLIRVFGNGTIGDGGEKANLKAFMSDDSMQSGICVDTCIEQQVYQSIKDAGKAGIVATVSILLFSKYGRLIFQEQERLTFF